MKTDTRNQEAAEATAAISSYKKPYPTSLCKKPEEIQSKKSGREEGDAVGSSKYVIVVIMLLSIPKKCSTRSS